ncbi:hypothetical protein CBS470a_000645 [Colletotrichum nupharicola]|nr:hypothetical protein CBS470a_000645 [Colletotrichum nupharicola]
MFETVRKWVDESPHKHELSRLLSSESVKAGKNHILSGEASRGHDGPGHSHGAWDSFGEIQTTAMTKTIERAASRTQVEATNLLKATPPAITVSLNRKAMVTSRLPLLRDSGGLRNLLRGMADQAMAALDTVDHRRASILLISNRITPIIRRVVVVVAGDNTQANTATSRDAL